MVEAFIEWRAQTRGELTEVGIEVDVDGSLGTPRDDGGEIRLRGRVDRLERDAAGRLVIVDIKTGKTPVSKDDAQQHAQLAMYQLAVAEGLIRAGRRHGARRRAAGLCGQDGGRRCHSARAGSADNGRPGRMAQPRPAGGRCDGRAAVHRPAQRRLHALPDTAVLPGPRRRVTL